MSTVNKTVTIGGLPAAKFIGRSIKVTWGDGNQHPSPCKCISVEGDTAVVVVSNGRNTRSHRVQFNQCKPWWSANPDLKAEAEAIGVVFNGEVSVGRAFAAAIDAGELAPVEPVVPEPVLTPAVQEVPVIVTAPPAAAVEQPNRRQSSGPRKLLKLEVPASGDGSWLADMQEYYALGESLRTESKELDTLREKIKTLQQELDRKTEEQLRMKEENQTMLDLLVEQLESKGVVFHWDTEKATRPEKTQEDKGTEMFLQSMRLWVKQRRTLFGFAELFSDLGYEDTSSRRKSVLRYCNDLGFHRESHRGPGAKTTFSPVISFAK